MHRGFIPLHRKTKDNWIYEDCNKLGAWCKILMEVNHKPNKKELDGEIVSCGRGQSINSLVTWARVFGKGWTVAKVRTFFKTLQKDSMIVLEGLRKTTRLTVCNYESYNNDKQTDNTHLTDRQQTDNTHLTTNNNVNNENNENNVNLTALKKPAKTLINNFKKWTEEDFKKEIKAACENKDYSLKIKKDFFDYWSETNEKGIMAFQLKKTWSTGKRLSKWNSNNNNFAKG